MRPIRRRSLALVDADPQIDCAAGQNRGPTPVSRVGYAFSTFPLMSR